MRTSASNLGPQSMQGLTRRRRPTKGLVMGSKRPAGWIRHKVAQSAGRGLSAGITKCSKWLSGGYSAQTTVDQLERGSLLLTRHRKTPASDRKRLCCFFTFCRASPIGSYAGSHFEKRRAAQFGGRRKTHDGRRPISYSTPRATVAPARRARSWFNSAYLGDSQDRHNSRSGMRRGR
jgi:hypothetical protein